MKARSGIGSQQSKRARCVLCGSNSEVERHHIGGRFHIAWFTVPLCRQHHVRLTEMLRAAGVEMTFTNDRMERTKRILKAVLVFVWMVIEMI